MNDKFSTVLLIEDNEGDVKLIESMIKEEDPRGFRLELAKSLGQGIEYLSSNRADMILLDLSLPDSRGLDTFTVLHASIPSDIPIVVLSGLEDRELAIKAVHAGAQDYLVKGSLDGGLLIRSINYAIERKKAHEEKDVLLKKLAYKEKLASLGKLAGGVAHEINNPLASILSTAELLLDELPYDSPYRESLDMIIKESQRIRDTVKSFIGFAKDRTFDFKRYNINAVVENALNIIGRRKLEGFRVTKKLTEPLTEVKISRFHIEEVFVSIITNGLQSMAPGGELTITTGEDEENVIIKFKDTGEGIDKGNMEKIFEPYFTTRNKKGTGLGLTSSNVIVTQHGGIIKVNSGGRGRGSEFSVYLPKK
ncbi:MAG: response regulator [Elusimicrobia bacterium]|nr:response regulator [Elusimicrobiota bacterium]